jgi:stalled ribosome rescue protein Dom34
MMQALMSSANISFAAAVEDTKAAREVKVLQDFFTMLSSDPARAFYGPGMAACRS